MTVRKVDGVTLDADTLDGDQLATIEATMDTKILAAMPSGMIIMWHGTIASIPTGWVICNGDNDTPNLLGRFVEGVATAGTNPGTTGGSTAKTTNGHTHSRVSGAPHMMGEATYYLSTDTDSITDIRPLFYDIAFIMKT